MVKKSKTIFYYMLEKENKMIGMNIHTYSSINKKIREKLYKINATKKDKKYGSPILMC